MMFDPSAFAPRQTLSVKTPEPFAFDPAAIAAGIEAEKKAVIDLRTAPLGPVEAWSFSRLMDYEKCPYSVYLAKVCKAPTPSGPAAERGTKIHNAIEAYIKGESAEEIKEMRGFLPLIRDLREGYANATVEVEGDWAFTRNWQTTGWTSPDCWARIKLDVLVHESDTSARVIDWKSGKKFGNEIKHNQQGMTYAIGAFKRYPNLEFVKVEFDYVDKNDQLTNQYTRAQAELLEPMLTQRADTMTTAVKFDPKPSFSACRWCPHKDIQEGHDKPACEFYHEHLI
ncbi:PD-(D/E)XK nuclease family protein [Pseudomonas luteola]|uniref:RecB family exonuclease n=1 Tax=Pseudomonas luteola TaxID=47886 RepID=UPI003A8687B7